MTYYIESPIFHQMQSLEPKQRANIETEANETYQSNNNNHQHSYSFFFFFHIIRLVT